ncbi:hypothetical protein N9X03_03155 [Planktomarina temperata]|nr:hypothetical protein [Planktomarina temperata]
MTAKQLRNKLSKKTPLLMSPFGFALAACGESIRNRLMLRTFFSWFVVIGLVTGCSDGAIGMKESRAWHQTASNDVKRSYFSKECEAFGYSEGTAEMNTCIERRWTDSNNDSKARYAERRRLRRDTNTYDDSALRNKIEKLERENRRRDTQCIIDGGVPSGGMCL